MRLQITAPQQISASSIALPESKSISNRALLISALCGGAPQVLYPAMCDDTAVMIDALARNGGHIDVGAAGTAMRFLTAYFATRQGMTVTLDGVERMRQRPIAGLVDALRSLGAHINYLDQEGFPPLLIKGSAMHGGTVVMDGSVSSQFVSAVMMILPTISDRLQKQTIFLKRGLHTGMKKVMLIYRNSLQNSPIITRLREYLIFA